MENADPVLGRAVRASLRGPHAHLALAHGRAVRYDPEVCPFVAPPEEPGDEQDWIDLAALLEGGTALLPRFDDAGVPAGWEVARSMPGVQMVDTGAVTSGLAAAGPTTTGPATTGSATTGAPASVVLGPDDVDDVLALVARTRPGPFLRRTLEMGTYLGVREGDRLVAMAGERMHPPGFTEISAVCTDADQQGRGLASRLVLAVAAGIRARGETPFLHASASNTGAIALYERLGFRLSGRPSFTWVRPPRADDVTLGPPSERAPVGGKG